MVYCNGECCGHSVLASSTSTTLMSDDGGCSVGVVAQYLLPMIIRCAVVV